MTELFIDGKKIDLGDDTIVLSYGVNNLFDIQSTAGSYSNTFKIPATANNNLALGITNNVLSVSDAPYKSLPCEIYVNGIVQIVGIAQIKSASRFEYELLVIGGNGNWIDKIADKNLQSVLQSCAFNQFWNEATVTGSRANIWSDIFIYPNIDYGDLFFLPAGPYNVNWNDLYPGIYVKYLFKKIFNDMGYNINSEWFDNDPLFQKQIIPFSAAWARFTDTTMRDVLRSEATADFSPPSNIFAPNGDNWFILDQNTTSCYPYVNQVKWVDPFANPFFDVNPGKCWLFMDSAFVTFKYDITVDRQFNTPTFDFCQLTYYDHSGTQQYYPIYSLIGQPVGLYNFTGEVTLPIGRGAVAFGAETNAIWKAGSYIEITGFELSDDTGALDINTVFNWVELGATLPDISVQDFMLTIASQYGLIFQEDKNSNTIKIIQFTDIVHNISNANDWSDRLDLSEEPTISFEVDQLAQKNIFKYSPDDADEYLMRQTKLGEGFIQIDQKALTLEQVIFESVFSAMVRLLSYLGSLELAYIPFLEGTDVNDVNQRMAYVEFDTSALLTIQPSGFFSTPQPNVYFEQLDFKNLLPKYYPLYAAILNNNKTVTCLLKLSTLDINNLDFSKPVWIEYFGAFFYMNLIDQYNVTDADSTSVQLILISN